MNHKKLEYEIRIYKINEKQIKNKILQLGGKLIQSKKIMPLIVYHHPNKKKNCYIRIRDEGFQITLTFKTNLKSKYPVEREVTINNIEEGDAILKALGCKVKYKIEKIREIYQLEDCKEIVFDSYAGIPTYLEIDCHSEESLINISNLLGFSLKDHDKRSLTKIYYNLYGIPKKIDWGGDVTIKKAKEIFLPHITKNKNKFLTILNQQLKLT